MNTQEKAPASTDPRFEIAARLLKNGYAAMSRKDKAAFGIDTWHTSTDTPEELQARVAAWIEELAHSFVPQGFKRVQVRIPFSAKFVTAVVPQALESKDEILDWIRSNTAISGTAQPTPQPHEAIAPLMDAINAVKAKGDFWLTAERLYVKVEMDKQAIGAEAHALKHVYTILRAAVDKLTPCG